jgi:hypothetical protein
MNQSDLQPRLSYHIDETLIHNYTYKANLREIRNKTLPELYTFIVRNALNYDGLSIIILYRLQQNLISNEGRIQFKPWLNAQHCNNMQQSKFFGSKKDSRNLFVFFAGIGGLVKFYSLQIHNKIAQYYIWHLCSISPEPLHSFTSFQTTVNKTAARLSRQF